MLFDGSLFFYVSIFFHRKLGFWFLMVLVNVLLFLRLFLLEKIFNCGDALFFSFFFIGFGLLFYLINIFLGVIFCGCCSDSSLERGVVEV